MIIKKAIFLIVLSLTTLSCKRIKKSHGNTKNHAYNVDSIKYSNQIIGVAINAHLLNGLISIIPNNLKKEISKIRREVKDTSLGITLRLHSWGDGQGFAPEIIYVSNNKNFEYAFPFRDEYYYYELQPYWGVENRDKDLIQWFNYQMNFTQQFNFILSGLCLNKKYKLPQLQRFITIFEDSLLKMNPITYGKNIQVSREITLKDTTYLKSIVIHERFRNERPCSDSISKNINNIIEDLKKYPDKSVRYFRPIEGGNAFWRFEIISCDDSTLRVETSFEDKECYFNMFW